MGVGRDQGRRDIAGKESGMKYQMRDIHDIKKYTRGNLDKRKRERDNENFGLASVIIIIAFLVIAYLIITG